MTQDKKLPQNQKWPKSKMTQNQKWLARTDNSIPKAREQEGNEEKTFPKFRNGKKTKKPIPRWIFGWIFGKIPNDLRPPHILWKLYFNSFYDEYGCIYPRGYGGQIVWNACTWFPEIGTILRGGEWGSIAVWNLSENLSDLVASPVPNKRGTSSIERW